MLFSEFLRYQKDVIEFFLRQTDTGGLQVIHRQLGRFQHLNLHWGRKEKSRLKLSDQQVGDEDNGRLFLSRLSQARIRNTNVHIHLLIWKCFLLSWNKINHSCTNPPSRSTRHSTQHCRCFSCSEQCCYTLPFHGIHTSFLEAKTIYPVRHEKNNCAGEELGK